MYQKKKIALMLIVILVMQVMFPMLSVVMESSFTIISEATGEISSGEWTYTVNDDRNTITIIEYTGTDAELAIPSEIDGYSVTVLGDGSIKDRLYGGKGYCEYGVFAFCSAIEYIKLPNTLKEIRRSAFTGCNNLIGVELNEGLQKIGNDIFNGCHKLQEINIPSTVNTIEINDAFNAFYHNDGVKSITVHADNQYYSSEDGVLFNKEKSILITYPSAKTDESYVVPDSVVQIYGFAFYNNINIKNLYIPQNVNKMKGEYWENHFNTFAVQGCINLQNIEVNEANEEFCSENGILYNKEKTQLILYPSGKVDTYYNMPSSVEKIAKKYTIYNQYIETIKINSAINNTEFIMDLSNLKNIEVDSENESFIQKNGILFNKDGNKIVCYPTGRLEETYTIDSNVTEIGDKAFINTKLTEIILPTTVRKIGGYSFYNCTKLDNVIIPSNVTEIGEYAFYNCINLSSITIPSKVTKIGQKAFYNCTNMGKLIFEENSQIENFGYSTFSNCSKLEEANIPEGITYYDCFDGCDNLRIISLPKTVSDIAGYSFDANYTRPQIITINNENPTISQGWAFSSPDFGVTVIRCHSTATNVINWVKSKGYFNYNLIDLDEDDEKFLYTIMENNEVLINKYIGDEENVQIPSQIEGYPVTEIAELEGTFKTISIPTTIKKIGKMYSSNLENIYVDEENQYFTSKDGVLFDKTEKTLLFYPMGRKDKSYNIPETTTSLGQDVHLSWGSTYYTTSAFGGSLYLESIHIPKTITQITKNSLNTENLSEIIIDEENQKYKVKDNILYEINNNEAEIITVPHQLEGNVELLYGLTKISTYTFENINKLEAVVIPTTVKKIYHNAFTHCNNLKKLVISPITELTEINSANLSFGNASNQLKVYCEDETPTQEHARKWGMDYEIIEPTKIEIKQKPEKLSYKKNEETLNLEGGLVTITYDDGTLLDLDMTSDLLSVTSFYNSSIGKNQIEIDYKGCKSNFSVERIIPLGISVTTAPSKTTYIEGQNFDKTGMVVQAIYNDGSTETVENYTVTDGNNLTAGKTSVTISYTENGVTKTATLGITVEAKELTEINITATTSIKTNYIEGQNFDKTGIVVKAKYNDGSIKTVENYTITDGNNLTAGKTSVTISYTENGVTKTATLGITVEEKELTEINITATTSIKTNYIEGQNFDKTGMVVQAIYNDGTSKNVTNYTITDGNNLTAGKTSVTISYTENGVTKTTTLDITVTAKELTGLNITATSTSLKTNYIEGQNFDKTGMVVRATYNDGTSKNVTNYTITDGNNLTAGKTSVTISYTENGVTKTATLGITVEAKELTEINITTTTSIKTNYIAGQNFDKTGMVVRATYNDGTSKNVTNYTITDGNNLTAGKTSVTISYTENGVTKTTTQSITVREKLYVEINELDKIEKDGSIYLESIHPSTNVKNLLKNIKTNGTVEIYKNTEKVTDENTKLATGMNLKISLENEQIEYAIVVIGDLNGDGEMGDIDVLKLARYKAGLDTKLSGAYLEATNVHKDENYADDIDLLKMVRVLVGLDILIK